MVGLFLACALFWARRAEAATVAILRPASDAAAVDEALFRLQGELLAVGLAVALTERPPTGETGSAETRAWLTQMASERHIDAFIDVVGVSAPEAVDVWIFEREPRRLKASRVTLEANTPDRAATLAIRTIEVLRSNFLVLDLAAPRRTTPAPQATELPPEREAPAPRRPPFGLEAGATTLTSFDGVATAVMPVVRVGWSIGSSFALEATGAGFGTRPSVETAAGSVEVAQYFALFGASAAVPTGTVVEPLFALSVGALGTTLNGRALPPNVAHDVTQWTAVADGGAGLRLRPSERFYLTLAGHVQLTQPYVAIHFVDTLVATTGRPNLLLTFTLGAWL
ncbi:MAG TPA: hypothetical protein VFV94_01865 [Polyangiaceae bacterium]|nr:hypothetical protein [Polyangiaceae bacterium]